MIYNNTTFYIMKNRETNDPYGVVCVRYVDGKQYRAEARCSKEDTFNETFGKVLAQSRCNTKVLADKIRKVEKEYNEQNDELIKLSKKVGETHKFLMDLTNDYFAEQELETTLRFYVCKEEKR